MDNTNSRDEWFGTWSGDGETIQAVSAKYEANPDSLLRVDSNLFKGRRMISVRQFIRKSDGSIVPSFRNGINFPLSELKTALKGLLLLHDLATSQGWIPGWASSGQSEANTAPQRPDPAPAGPSPSPRPAKAASAALQAYQMHNQGMSYSQIGKQLGISRATVARYISRAASQAALFDSPGVSTTVSVETGAVSLETGETETR